MSRSASAVNHGPLFVGAECSSMAKVYGYLCTVPGSVVEEREEMSSMPRLLLLSFLLEEEEEKEEEEEEEEEDRGTYVKEKGKGEERGMRSKTEYRKYSRIRISGHLFPAAFHSVFTIQQNVVRIAQNKQLIAYY